MKKIYYLSTCDTCRRIIDELKLKERNFTFQDIKYDPVPAEVLDELYAQKGSYEALFNKRARKYRDKGLNKEDLQDEEFRGLILKEYTFLKRPVIQIDDNFYIGNSKKTIQEVKDSLNEYK